MWQLWPVQTLPKRRVPSWHTLDFLAFCFFFFFTPAVNARDGAETRSFSILSEIFSPKSSASIIISLSSDSSNLSIAISWRKRRIFCHLVISDGDLRRRGSISDRHTWIDLSSMNAIFVFTQKCVICIYIYIYIYIYVCVCVCVCVCTGSCHTFSKLDFWCDQVRVLLFPSDSLFVNIPPNWSASVKATSASTAPDHWIVLSLGLPFSQEILGCFLGHNDVRHL